MGEACILAGGRSSRMGQDKARLRLGGKSLLSYARAAATQAGFRVRLVRRDLLPSCGPLGGVYTGLCKTRSDGVLFLSCDMPFVTAAAVRSLCRKLKSHDDAVFTMDEGPGFPFLLRRSALGIVEDLLKRRQFSIQSLARRLHSASFQ